jgi:peroxiredoxin
MHRTAFVSSITLIVACLADGSFAQSEFRTGGGKPPQPPVHTSGTSTDGRGRVTTGVLIGEIAPDFELSGIDGKPLRLSSMRGQWVMVWFLEHRDSLVIVEPVAASLGKSGVRTVTVCYDKPQALAQRLRGQTLSYVPLADPTGDIVSLYGLLDTVREEVRPGYVLVDPRGAVKMVLLGHQIPALDAARLVQYSILGE